MPILYNDQNAVIKCAWIWDENNEENGYYVINGIFLTNDEFSVPDTRMEVTLQAGDVICPLYNDIGGGDDVAGEPITVGESGIEIALIWLPDGVYQYGFKFIDVYGNTY